MDSMETVSLAGISFTTICIRRFLLEPAFVTSIVLVLGVVFVNGWTDAPNAIGSAVGTRVLSPRTAILMAVVCNFFGILLMTQISSQVADTISKMVDFGPDARLPGEAGRQPIIVMAAAMFSIVAWAVAAWAFGIPTSESHALIAGLTGAALALGGVDSINMGEWSKVIVGLFVSSVLGFGSGWGIVRGIERVCRHMNRRIAERFFRRGEAVAAGLMAFLHGAQDGQKFMGVFMLAMFFNGSATRLSDGTFIIPLWVMVLCSLMMGAGTLVGGKKIIKTVGMDMVKMTPYQGFASDIAASICLLLASLTGLPVSTTHTKTTAMMGVAASHRVSSVDWGIAREMVWAWILTFPGCGLIGFVMAKLFLMWW